MDAVNLEPKLLFSTAKGCGLDEDAPQVSPSLMARREDDHSHCSHPSEHLDYPRVQLLPLPRSYPNPHLPTQGTG